MHPRNSFITLTYDSVNVPKDGSLNVSHWQKFAKRLRKQVGSFRFFHCGEYGEVNRRPHYHACLFGVDFADDRILLRRDGDRSLYFSPRLSATWGMGHCSVGELTYESAAYVARYCVGKITGERAEAAYGRFDSVTGEAWSVRPPYVTMSRRPGIGSTWFEKFSSDVYPSDEVVHMGRRFRPPRYYDGKLPEGELDLLKAKRAAKVAERSEELTYDRLRVRDESAELRAGRSKRGL